MNKWVRLTVGLIVVLFMSFLFSLLYSREVYVYEAYVRDKYVMFDEDGMQSYCVEIRLDTEREMVTKKRVICKKWARDVNWGYTHVGDMVIYKEVSFNWWWE